jgi:hypothetical protein
MDMKSKTTKWIIILTKCITWVAFIGLCIKAGALMFTFIMSVFWNPGASKDLYLGLDLSELQSLSTFYYITLVWFVVATSGLKAFLFYLAVQIFQKINFEQPFNESMATLVRNISFVALLTSSLIYFTNAYCQQLVENGADLTSLSPYLTGAPEFLFLAGIVFVISLVFRKGIEIQEENQLTV